MLGELRLSSERQARMAWLGSKRRRDSAAKMAGRRPGGQAEMGENSGDHGGLFDSGDDFLRCRHSGGSVRCRYRIPV